MKKLAQMYAAFFSAIFITACAFDVYRIDLTPVTLEPPATTQGAFELQQQVELEIGYGYKRRLKKDTLWTPLGSIPYGDVYQTRDQVLTVEASNVYEACIVMSAGELVGFYLPVEDAYYPLENRQFLSVKAVNTEP